MAVWDRGDKALEKGCNSKVWGRMGEMVFQARQRGAWVWLEEKYPHGLGGLQQKISL